MQHLHTLFTGKYTTRPKASRKITLLVCPFILLLFSLLLISPSAFAATITASATGIWSSTATWGGSAVPTTSDDVVINSGVTVTVDVNASCNSLTLAAGTNNTVSVNSGMTLTVTNAITANNSGSSNTTAALTGSGSITCGSITVGGTVTNPSLTALTTTTYTHTLTSSVNSLSISGNLAIISSYNYASVLGITYATTYDNGIFTTSGTGTATVGGSITTSNENSGNTATFTLGTSSTLYLTGSTPFNLSTTGTNTITLNNTGSTVNYACNGAQTVYSTNYYNLTLSVAGGKTLQTGTTSIAGNLTLSGTASTTTVVGLTIGGNLSIGDGSTFTVGGYNLTVTGSTTIGGGTSGVLNIGAYNGTKIFTGLVTINSGGTWDNTSTSSPVTFRGGITNNGTFKSGSPTSYTFDTNAQSLTGTIDMTGAAIVVTGITLTNNGTLTITASFSGTGTLLNASTGTINSTSYLTIANLTNNGIIIVGGSNNLTPSTLINTGTLNISGTVYTNPTTFTNSGTVNYSSSGGIGTALANFTNTGGTINLNGSGYITGITNNTGGTVNFINASQTIGTFINATSTSVLNISALITSASAINTLTSTASGNTVIYSGAGAQTIKNTTYSNLTLSGSGTQTFNGTTTINNLLTIIANCAASLTSGYTYTAAYLYFNNLGQASGSWGGTASSATNKSSTYFGTTAKGILNVTNGPAGFWYKADNGTGTTTNGNSVTTWTDQSGASNNANSQSGGIGTIIYTANAINFNPSVTFTGAWQKLLTANSTTAQSLVVVTLPGRTSSNGNANAMYAGLIGASTDYGIRLDASGYIWSGNASSSSTLNLNSNDWSYNGTSRINGTSSWSFTNWHIVNQSSTSGLSAQFYLGGYLTGYSGRQFTGQIAEVMAFPSSVPNQNGVESYLAIKYGITLGHDYTNGSGTTVYSISGYANDIAGLGNDATYGLNQKVSSSVNISSGLSRVVMATDTASTSSAPDFTSSNLASTRTIALTNGQYLVWGHNGHSATTFWNKGNYPVVYRIWKVQNTGSVGSVGVQVDLTGLTSASGLFTLVVANDTAFTSGVTEYLLTNSSGNVYYNRKVTFPSGTCYFTIGTPAYTNAVYVRVGGKGNLTGDTWSNAMPTVQQAVEVSNKMTTKLPVYVAAGTYSNNSTYAYTYNSASANFLMYSGVNVLGGFIDDGTSTNAGGTTVTRLTGTTPSTLIGSCTQVVAPSASSFSTATVWDGFTITSATSGAYAANIPSNATLQNCKITANSGGGLSLLAGASAYNVLIADNNGIGVSLAGTLVNVTIANNTGAAIYFGSAAAPVINSILWNNTGGNFSSSGSTPTNITYSAGTSTYSFSATGTSTGYASDIFNTNTSINHNIALYQRSPNFKDATNSTVANRNYGLLLLSPCLGAGSTSANTTSIDANGKARIYSGTIDLGAFQKYNDGFQVTGSTVLTKFRPSTATSLTVDSLSNAEVMVYPGATLSLSSKTITPKYLIISDSIGASAPIITGGTLTAGKVYYAKKFNQGTWNDFALPFTSKAGAIDGGTEYVASSTNATILLKRYSQNIRSLYGAVDSAWINLSTTDTIKPKLGYMLGFDSSVPNTTLANTLIFPSTGSVTFSNNSMVTDTITFTASSRPWYDTGWNFISGPTTYPVTINSTAGNGIWPLSADGSSNPILSVSGGVYFYNTGDYYDVQPIATVNSAGISPYTPFFVKTQAGISTIQLNSLSSSGSTPLRSRRLNAVSASESSSITTDSVSLFKIHTENSSGQSGDTYVIFYPEAHAGYVDIEDSPNMSSTSNGNNIVLNTFATGDATALGINTLPFTGTAMRIPLQISVPQDGSYTMTVPMKDDSKNVYFEDTNGQDHDLSSGYTFDASQSNVTNGNLVFALKSSGQTDVNTGINLIQIDNNVSITGTDNVKRITVFTDTGQLIREIDNPSIGTSIPLPSQPGLYLLYITTDKSTVTKRVIVH